MTESLFSEPVIQYILRLSGADGNAKLPPMDELADQLGVSRGKVREDLLVAQAFGLVEMRPGDGTYVRRPEFYDILRPIVLYSVKQDKHNLDYLQSMRAELEIAFWEPAVSALTESEVAELFALCDAAETKLHAPQIEVPQTEHRRLHVLLFSHLENPFVRAVLRVYWDAYEVAGLHRYFALDYHLRVWSLHRAIVQSIVDRDYERGRRLLREHFHLLHDRIRQTQ